MVLRHVRLAHVFGQPGRGRLLPREVAGRLHSITQRQGRVFVKISRFLHHADEVAAGEFAQHIAGALCLANVFGDQTGIGLAHFGQRFAGNKMNDVINVEARVGPAPAQHRNV